jgi:hypothetical protein
MKPLFRPLEFWQSALMTLPDTAFFDLMRSALGNIKTPFNKQKILEDLSTFLSRPEIQETAAAFLDDADRRIIAAIAVLGEPLPGELESFFSGEYSYAELHGLLINLEERFIVYRFREDGLFRIALNPRLEPILAPVAAGRSLLFSPGPEKPEPQAGTGPRLSPETGAPPDPGVQAEPAPAAALAGPLSGRLLAALFSFFLSGRNFFKPDAPDRGGSFSPRKKAVDEGEKLFPGLDTETIAGALLSLGVLEQDGEKFRAEGKRLSAFRELSPVCRLEYLAAGAALYLQSFEPNPLPGYIHRSLLKNTARFINSLLASLGFGDPSGKIPAGKDSGGENPAGEAPRLYPKPALLKCGEILRREETGSWNFAEGLPQTGIILKALETVALIVPVKEKYAVLPAGEDEIVRVSESNDSSESNGSSAVIAMDSPFSLVLYPGISFADALDLALFCEVEETGTAIRFSLSRESVVRGFNRGFRAGYLWRLLERLSGGRAGEALKWNLEDWEKRYREAALYQGVVLTLGRERLYLAESGPLAGMIRAVLAPGCFLLDVSRREEAAGVLREAGVDIFALPAPEPYGPPPELPAESESKSPKSDPRISPFGQEFGGGPFPELFAAQDAVSGGKSGAGAPAESGTLKPYDGGEAERLKEKFRARLESDGKRYSKEERAELLNRIERRLVVSESQLQDISIRYEKLEARSLDYAGKAAIAKQAIAQGSLLEAAWPSGGKQETVLGTPENLEKKGGETILILRPRNGRAEPVRIPLGKISVLRRIKQSIFGE